MSYAIKVETPQTFVKHGWKLTKCTSLTGKHQIYIFWTISVRKLPIGTPAYTLVNAADRAIHNYKSHLIAGLFTCDKIILFA